MCFPGTLKAYYKFSANPLQYTSANVNLVVVNVVVEIFLDLSGGSTDLQATSMAKNPSAKPDSSQFLVLFFFFNQWISFNYSKKGVTEQKGVAIVSCWMKSCKQQGAHLQLLS